MLRLAPSSMLAASSSLISHVPSTLDLSSSPRLPLYTCRARIRVLQAKVYQRQRNVLQDRLDESAEQVKALESQLARADEAVEQLVRVARSDTLIARASEKRMRCLCAYRMAEEVPTRVSRYTSSPP